MIKSFFSTKVRNGFLGLAFLGSLASCKKNNLVVDKDAMTPPYKAEFLYLPGAFTKTFFINSSNNEFAIPVGITAAPGETINFTYTSPTNAVAGTQYTAPTSLTMTGGKVIDSLRVKGLFAGYAGTRKDSLKIKITSSAGSVIGKDSVWLIMLKKCDVVLTALGGTYSKTNEYNSANVLQYGPYVTAVSGLTSTGATTATGKFVNLFDFGWTDITFNMDFSSADPSQWRITIPLQTTGATTGGGNYSHIRSSTTIPSTFSSCDQTFNLNVDLMSNATTVGIAGYQFRLAR